MCVWERERERDYNIIQVREVLAAKKKESEWGLPPWKCQEFLSRLTPVSLTWRLSGCCDVKLNKTLFLNAERVFHQLFLSDTSPPASQWLVFLLYVVHEQSRVLSRLFSYCFLTFNASSLARSSSTFFFIVVRKHLLCQSFVWMTARFSSAHLVWRRGMGSEMQRNGSKVLLCFRQWGHVSEDLRERKHTVTLVLKNQLCGLDFRMNLKVLLIKSGRKGDGLILLHKWTTQSKWTRCSTQDPLIWLWELKRWVM